MDSEEAIGSSERSIEGDTTESSNVVEGLIWENGIGTLPGTDIKFRMVNGEIEMIEQFNFPSGDEVEANGVTEDVKQDAAEEEENSQTKRMDELNNGHSNDIEMEDNSKIINEKDEEEDTNNSPSETVTCVVCGVKGTPSSFCGKFCSRACVGRNAARHKKMRADANRNSQTADQQTLEDKNHGMVISDKNNLKIKIRLSSSPDDNSHHTKRKSSQGGSTLDEPPKRRKFIWSQYLDSEKAKAVPLSVFRNALNRSPFPASPNPFKCGMALEGVDPVHQSIICCLSVAEVRGHRIRLHFEGFNEVYDYWTVADSPYLFSCGFCKRTGRKVTVPRGYTDDSFSWTNHVKKYKLFAAPQEIFEKNESESEENLFQVGQKLEAVDKQNPDLTCVATVTDKVANNILVHFDGWAHDFDYWCNIASNYIHPVGWCQANGKLLSPPEGYPDITNFTWDKYLNETSANAAVEKAFKHSGEQGFEEGMKLEVVDRRNPVLVRAATVAKVDSFRIKIHFDGWSKKYDLWADIDSEDLHPVGWCAQTGHILQPPILPEELMMQSGQATGGCPIPGCKGIGHVKGAKYAGHYSEFGCPYSPQNIHRDTVPDRLIPSKNSGRPPSQLPSQVSSKYSDGKRRQSNVFEDVNDPDFHTEHEARQSKKRALRQSISTNGARRRRSSTLHSVTGRNNKLVVSSNNINDLVDHNGDSFYSSKQHSVFVSALSSYPSYDLPLCWEQQLQLIPELKLTSKDEVANWTSDQVSLFVKKLTGNPQHGEIFKDQEIDGEAMLLLTQGDIAKSMRIKLGPAVKIYNAILLLKTSQNLPV